MDSDNIGPREKPSVEEAGAKGGKVAAANMTTEERRERAKKAAAARWAGNLPRATHGSPDRPLRIANIEIPCYVLGDGRRVIVRAGVIMALGMSEGTGRKGEGDRLAKFVSGKSLNPFISNELLELIKNPIRFKVPSGGVEAYGYEATILADLCDAVLEARKKGELHHQQYHIAKQCEILVRAFAKTGIVALVDEATGYQFARTRDELQRLLERYVSKELARWERTFQADFYERVYQLKDWPYNPSSTRRSHQVARITVDLTYDRIHPDLLKELKQIRSEGGKPNSKLFQWLTTAPSGGHPRLKQHLEGITALMKVAKSWTQFMRWVDQHYPKLNQTMLLPLIDPEDEEQGQPS